jgi:hypothetical protein
MFSSVHRVDIRAGNLIAGAISCEQDGSAASLSPGIFGKDFFIPTFL